MKIKLATLRRLIREEAMQPNVFSNKPVEDPMDKPNIAKAVQDLQNSFKRALDVNLVVSMQDKYNSETKDFDDATLENIKRVGDETTDQVMAKVHEFVKKGWITAHKLVKDGTSSGGYEKDTGGANIPPMHPKGNK